MLKVILSAVFCALLLAAPAEISVFGSTQKTQNESSSKPVQNEPKLQNTENLSKTEQSSQPAPNQANKQFSNVLLSPEQLRNLAASDEPETNQAELYEDNKALNITLNATLNKEKVFVFEPFSVELKMSSVGSFRPSISARLNGAKLLNPKVKFTQINKNELSATLWFVPINTAANIEEIAVIIKRGDEFVARQSTNVAMPKIQPLPSNEEFSNVVADELVVKSFKSSKFDEFSNLINLEIEAKNGNLSEFKIPFANSRGGVENIKGGVDKMSASYFLIAPSDIKNISFSYYNLSTGGLEFIDVPVRPAMLDLSTQTNLNPSQSEFVAYKSIAIYVVIIIGLLGFMLWRSFYGLVLAIVFGVWAFWDAKPFAGAVIKANSHINILPTKNSSTFYIPKEDEDAKVLGTHNNYTKVLLKGDKIGWVRNENIK